MESAHAYFDSEGTGMIQKRHKERSYLFALPLTAAMVATWILPNPEAILADEAKSQRQKQPFSVSIPKSAVIVELIGICSSPQEGRRWWRADGAPLEIEPCERWANSYAVKWAQDRSPGAKKYELSLRIAYKGAERATTKWKFAKGGQGWLDIGHEPKPGIRSVFVAESANVDAINFKVAVATGSWQTDCTYPRASQRVDFSPRESAGYVVVWQRPAVPEENYPGRTKLNVIHDFADEYEIRVLLSDVHGAIHNPVQTKSNRAGRLTVFRGYYAPEADLIEEFQLQIRPLYWIQFQNVSLRAGFKTKPEIRLCKTAEIDAD